VLAFDRARFVTDPEEKRCGLVIMMDRFFPNCAAGRRPATEQETKATVIVTREIERASTKVKAKGVADDDRDYALPVSAKRLPAQVLADTAGSCPCRERRQSR
jgi:uncharacterized protein